MVCLHCGRVLENNANFCSRCGQPTHRDAPFIRLYKDGRYLRGDRKGLLSCRYDRETRRCLAKELKLGRFPSRARSARIREAFDRLADESPDILANMTGGTYLPDADIVTVNILFYPGNPDIDRLTPRTYLSVLTCQTSVHFALPWDYRPDIHTYQPLMLHFPEKDRGMLLLKHPLERN